ncbi:hypothetical protein E2C01_063557 [Portunus trituberculatus]|uniref:Uncharacterized protein n=1 Tax=Portunus trituberculatus TaxID=210409 RepID=A0A5B7HL71_PORTR|nr:hypothetical protein [Portunus trituberculatus]
MADGEQVVKKEELGAMANVMRATAGPVRRMSAQSHGTHPIGSGLAPGWRRETDKTENPPRTVPPLALLAAAPPKTASLPHQWKACSPPATSPPRASSQPAAAPSATPRRPRPQQFDGRVLLEAYLDQFEVVARAQGWSQE